MREREERAKKDIKSGATGAAIKQINVLGSRSAAIM